MSSDKSTLLKRLLKRRSFPGLMDLYEGNYVLLQRLIPDLGSVGPSEVSRASGSPDLHLRVLERCKYTTTLLLTYYFEAADGTRIADPDLRVRVYHDARVVETMACRRGGYMVVDPLVGKGKKEMDCRWDSNLFLRKWLEYSLAQGHGFHGRSRYQRRQAVEPAETF